MLLRLPRCVLPTGFLVAGIVNLALQVMNLTVSRGEQMAMNSSTRARGRLREKRRETETAELFTV
jgi:hypothetical protein